MSDQLRFLNGPLAGREVGLLPRSKTVLGRSPECQIAVEVPGVSRYHCRINCDGRHCHLVDLGSVNGTFVNGERAARHVLQHGDQVSIGSIKFVFRRDVAQCPAENQQMAALPPEASSDLPWSCDVCGTLVEAPGPGDAATEGADPKLLCESCRPVGWILGGNVGHFRVVSKIAEGGMGTVFRAHQEVVDRPVALKILKSEFASEPRSIKRFLREARASASLSHPNIVPLYDAGQFETIHYIAMEYIDGPSAAQVLDTSGFGGVGGVLKVAIQMAHALAHAFGSKVVHRDVKPSNIMLTHSGAAKLTDFGLAKFMYDAGLSSITEAGTSMGTLAYMSPEHLRDARAVDYRGDIYSLGATIYHMLTGQHAFSSGSFMQTARKILSQPPPSPGDLNPKVPELFSKVVQRMMATDAQARYQTPKELLNALQEVRTDLKRTE